MPRTKSTEKFIQMKYNSSSGPKVRSSSVNYLSKITKILLLLLISTCYSIEISSASTSSQSTDLPSPSSSSSSLSSSSPSKSYLYGMLDHWINRINFTLSHFESTDGEDGLNVSSTCINHMRHLLIGASDRHAWALKIFDSMGKPGAGLMEASLSFLGVYSECTQTLAPQIDPIGPGESSTALFAGKYCLSNLNLPGKSFWELIKLKKPSPNAILTSITPKLGLCFPSTCTTSDIQAIASHALANYIPNATLTISTCSSKSDQETLMMDTPALIVIGMFSTIILILGVGTLVDYWFNYHSCYLNNNNSSDCSTISSTCSSTISRSSGKMMKELKDDGSIGGKLSHGGSVLPSKFDSNYGNLPSNLVNCNYPSLNQPFRPKTPTITSHVSLTSIGSSGSQRRLRCRTSSSNFCDTENGRNAVKCKLINYLTALSFIENGKKILSVSKSSSSLPSSSSSNSSSNPYTGHHRSIGGHTNRLTTDGSGGSLASLHGLRVIMMIWIVSGHSYSFAIQWLSFANPNDLTRAPKNFISQIFANGTFSVDTFLFISGLLMSHLCLKQLAKSHGSFNLPLFYLHRYIRMTPVMMAIIAFTSTLMKYITSGGPSFQQSTLMFDSWCQKNWYLNVLYIHNFVNRENMCLPHTWYSAVDMQLYLIAPLILIPLYHRPKLGVTLIVTLLLSSSVATAFITITRHLPAVPYLSESSGSTLAQLNEYYGSIYIKPYTRSGPYLVGILLGFIIHMVNGTKVTLSPKMKLLGWSIAITGNLAVIFAMLPINQGSGYVLNDVLAGLYSGTSRVIWSMTTAWVIFCCHCGQGGFLGRFLSSKYWLPWSKLTYCAYLIHPIVMALFYGSRQVTYEFSHFLMVYIILGNIIITYIISFFLSLIFESPIVSIEKLLTSNIINKFKYSPSKFTKPVPVHL